MRAAEVVTRADAEAADGLRDHAPAANLEVGVDIQVIR